MRSVTAIFARTHGKLAGRSERCKPNWRALVSPAWSPPGSSLYPGVSDTAKHISDGIGRVHPFIARDDKLQVEGRVIPLLAAVNVLAGACMFFAAIHLSTASTCTYYQQRRTRAKYHLVLLNSPDENAASTAITVTLFAGSSVDCTGAKVT